MDGDGMSEQTYRTREEAADHAPSQLTTESRLGSAAMNRGYVLPRFDPAKLRQHLPNSRRIRIEINGVLSGTPEAIPDATAEFAIGWAFVHRFFSTADQLGKVSATAGHVSLMVNSGIDMDRIKYEAIGWIPRRDLEVDQAAERSTRSPKSVSVMSEMDVIVTSRQAYDRFDDDGARAGYVHAALATADDILCVARDLHAGAAASKVLGWTISTRVDCSASILVVRGVLEGLIVEAAARAGIPIVATDAVPTASAVAAASSSCVTVLGLALSHRRGLFSDGGHLGEDVALFSGAIGPQFETPDA
jgi:formate dehydrogenase accessory protein FdhD